MREGKKRYKSYITLHRLILTLCLFLGLTAGLVYAAVADSTDNRKLQNGSFEDRQTFTKDYSQPDQSAVPSWNTTAFQGKIELFRENTGTYINSVYLKPTDGTYAAELNADEESTLYQNVKTTPSSIYEWGLDHGGRNGTDTMALVIGPKQSVDPSKPSKAGRDQFMQMIDWLIDQGKTSIKTSAGLGEQLTVYSKKFAANGTFADNVGNNAFSLTPSTIYTEEWHVWIMASSRATSGTNPWYSYGSNAEGSAGSSGDSGVTEVDTNKYYLYKVPAGQTDTVFGFVSVGYVDSTTTGDKAKTYGNFLDNINFQLYHPLSASTTHHGSAVVGASDGTTEGEGAEGGHKVTVDKKLATYVVDGESLKIQAIVTKADAEAGCEFIGVSHTYQDSGNPTPAFISTAGKEIVDTGSLTDEEKKDKWIKSTNDAGDIIYTYNLEGITSATDLHFIFIKSPTVTYDPNGGKAYVVERSYNTDEAPNVYSFKPDIKTTKFISPYVSHAAEGQNEGWKFMGWLLTGDVVTPIPEGTGQVNANLLGSLLLPAEHTVACDYSTDDAMGQTAAQYFKIYTGKVSLTETINKTDGRETNGVNWMDHGETKVYANMHKGLTMVAQWRWRQAFIPQVNSSGDTYTDSERGGKVEITSVTNASDTNYNDAYGPNGGKSYHAMTDETVTATATAKPGYTFEGWYDADGNLMTTNATYSYPEEKEGVHTYYARFSGNVTQTYIRQIKNGDTWEDTTNDNIGTLGRYTYTDAAGMPISSTATAGTGYKFVGWYDSAGNRVTHDMLINEGATLSYTTMKDATYYARFEIDYQPTVESQVYLSFIAESENTQIPSAFEGRNAGTGKNTKDYGLDSKYGNTIATGFKYSINTMTDVSTIQITVNVPASSYVKVGGTGSFTGNGTSILTDGAGVAYNKGSIQQISGATTLTYYWDASGLQANTKYGFIIDNLYAPGATATITVNGTEGTSVTNDNGVVNTAFGEYKSKSHYNK